MYGFSHDGSDADYRRQLVQAAEELARLKDQPAFREFLNTVKGWMNEAEAAMLRADTADKALKACTAYGAFKEMLTLADRTSSRVNETLRQLDTGKFR